MSTSLTKCHNDKSDFREKIAEKLFKHTFLQKGVKFVFGDRVK